MSQTVRLLFKTYYKKLYTKAAERRTFRYTRIFSLSTLKPAHTFSFCHILSSIKQYILFFFENIAPTIYIHFRNGVRYVPLPTLSLPPYLLINNFASILIECFKYKHAIIVNATGKCPSFTQDDVNIILISKFDSHSRHCK